MESLDNVTTRSNPINKYDGVAFPRDRRVQRRIGDSTWLLRTQPKPLACHAAPGLLPGWFSRLGISYLLPGFFLDYTRWGTLSKADLESDE
jgi:hypothetical protein